MAVAPITSRSGFEDGLSRRLEDRVGNLGRRLLSLTAALTTGAESNLLKLAELRGRMTAEQEKRWHEIKRGFARRQVMGGDEEDPAIKVIGQLALLSDRLQDIGRTIESASNGKSGAAELGEALGPYLENLHSRRPWRRARTGTRPRSSPRGSTG